MDFKGLVKKVCIGSVALGISLSLAGCPSMITEEQLAQLQELRKKERSLNQEIADAQSEISKIEAEVNARQRELDDCNDRLEFVKDKLSKWPDVWPK
jgi:peptidoglycan hydrolase CwlO-like protein